MITPEMYNELRIQEQQGQEMADEKNKSIQLRKDIMKRALAESATDCTIMCGTLFAKFSASIHEQMATNLKKTLQTFFDNRKVNDCYVQMSGTLPDNEYAYETVPIKDEDPELTYNERVRWISSLRGNYQYLYQANTRNLLTVNVSPFVQIERDIPQYMTPAISGRNAYNIVPSISANANYYN